MLADPLNIDQLPVPCVGVLPCRIELSAHKAWSGPAKASVGIPFVILTVSLDEQISFVMVHCKILSPLSSPLTRVSAWYLSSNTAEPEPPSTDHIPVPADGLLASSIVVSLQISWTGPASASTKALFIVTSSYFIQLL